MYVSYFWSYYLYHTTEVRLITKKRHNIRQLVKGYVFSDSSNLFLWHKLVCINKISLFPKCCMFPILCFWVIHDYFCVSYCSMRYIVDLQNDEIWEGKGSRFIALWKDLGSNFDPFSFPQCIMLGSTTYLIDILFKIIWYDYLSDKCCHFIKK